jgi:formylglycine-generating enzyme required for sulfatase activity
MTERSSTGQISARVVGLLVLFVTCAYSQPDISPAAKAEILTDTIIAAQEKQDWRAVISAIEQYKRLGHIPPPLLVSEAEAAEKMGDFATAKSALSAYLNQAKPTDHQYHDAITMYERVQEKGDQSTLVQYAHSVKLVPIPGGKFKMGTDYCVGATFESDVQRYHHCNWYLRWSDKSWIGPEHWVTVKPFKLQTVPIPFETFKAFARQVGIGNPEWPSYEAAVALAKVLGSYMNLNLRLATEAEWAFAMLSGNKQGGLVNTCAADECLDLSTDNAYTKHSNPYRLEFPVDGVVEMTSDCWHSSFDGAPTDGSAWELDNCTSGLRAVHPSNTRDSAYTRLPSQGTRIPGRLVFRLAVSVE